MESLPEDVGFHGRQRWRWSGYALGRGRPPAYLKPRRWLRLLSQLGEVHQRRTALGEPSADGVRERVGRRLLI